MKIRKFNESVNDEIKLNETIDTSPEGLKNEIENLKKKVSDIDAYLFRFVEYRKITGIEKTLGK